MSTDCSICGFIVERGNPDEVVLAELRRKNDQALQSLPQPDTRTALSRDMFSVASDPAVLGGFSTSRLIHFAGLYRGLEYGFSEWLDKFEKLLSNLDWWEARVIMDAEYGGHMQIDYNRSNPADRPFNMTTARIRLEKYGEDALIDLLGKSRFETAKFIYSFIEDL